MELNKTTKLKKGERVDVAYMQRNQRIMYFPKTQEIRLKASDIFCKAEPDYKECIVLSQSKAAKAYPDLFFNSSKALPYDPDNIQTTIKLTREQDAFCRRHGTLSGYIKSLIDKEMKKEAKK